MHITQENIDNANKCIDEQIKFRNWDLSSGQPETVKILNDRNCVIRMAVALDLICTILFDYDGYENDIDGLKSIIDESYSLVLATEYWKVFQNDSSVNAQ